jgi:hypothetical protein
LVARKRHVRDHKVSRIRSSTVAVVVLQVWLLSYLSTLLCLLVFLVFNISLILLFWRNSYIELEIKKLLVGTDELVSSTCIDQGQLAKFADVVVIAEHARGVDHALLSLIGFNLLLME